MQAVRGVSRVDHEEAPVAEVEYTTREGEPVQEIVGFERAYEEFSDDQGLTLRFTHFTIRIISNSAAEAGDALSESLTEIWAELKKLGGGTIFWRLRPTVTAEFDGSFAARCRLATSPPLPEELWARLTNQGEGVDLRKKAA